MKDKKFNPKEWLDEKPNVGKSEIVGSSHMLDQREKPKSPSGDLGVNDFEIIVKRIESTQTDITGSYSDWRDLGFALADEFGESGRDYYHRLSRFYPDYSASECNKQFDACLKSKGQGITLKTFFHLSKQAGIDIQTNATPLLVGEVARLKALTEGFNSKLKTRNSRPSSILLSYQAKSTPTCQKSCAKAANSSEMPPRKTFFSLALWLC
jgi:hypothetical protein